MAPSSRQTLQQRPGRRTGSSQLGFGHSFLMLRQSVRPAILRFFCTWKMNHARPEKMKSNNLNLNFRKSNNKNKNGRDYGAVDPRGIGSITCAVPAGTRRNPPSPPDSPCPATCGVIRSNSLAFNKTLSPVSAVYSHSITQRAHTHTHTHLPARFLGRLWMG